MGDQLRSGNVSQIREPAPVPTLNAEVAFDEVGPAWCPEVSSRSANSFSAEYVSQFLSRIDREV